MRSPDLRGSLLAAWKTNNRVTVSLVAHLPAALWDLVVPGTPGRTIRAIAAHLHNARCRWVKTLGREHGITAPLRVDHRRVARRELVAQSERTFMTRYQTAQVLAGISAVGFLLAAGLHVSEYRRVVLQAEHGFGGLAPLVATLWLTFAAALFILGLIVTLVAFGRVDPGRPILELAGCFPAVTVILQLHFLGFTAPVAVFSAVAAVTFAAALTYPAVGRLAPSEAAPAA